MNTRYGRWLTMIVSVLTIHTTYGQAPASVGLADVQRLKCTFTLLATGTWNKDVPSAQVTPATLSMEFDAIDTQEGTANVVDVSAASAGAPHITVRLLGDNLHFLAMNSSGSVYLTTVFWDREGRAAGRYKAVHTRHEFTQIRLASYTSRPEQYYGLCEPAK
jgi:hypothetical protein